MNNNIKEFSEQKKIFLNRLSKKKIYEQNFNSFLSVLKSILNPNDFLKKTRYFLMQFDTHLAFNKSKTSHVYGKEMIDFILNEDKSFIRFGDGEIFHFYKYNVAAFKKNQTYQPFNNKLTEELNTIVKELNKDSNFHLAINLTAIKMNNLENFKTGLYTLHYLQRYFFKKELFSKFGVTFLDLLAFRPESKLPNSEISRLWKDRDVIIVNSDKTIHSKFREQHSTGKTMWVEIPSVNAYEKIDSIMNQLHEILLINNNILILVAAGAAGKAIVYRLSKLNYIAYDLGHYFDWKFQGLLHE